MVSAFVGRGFELSKVERALGGIESGGALLFFTGEPGIGKTRLADHAAKRAQACGMQVVWGRCWEAGGAPAYWPWIEVFRGLGVADDPFASALSQGGSEARQGRFHLFDQTVRALSEAARKRPLAIVLDDLHAADVPSLLVLQLLARSLRGAPIAVIGTYREVEARLGGELGALLTKISREGEVFSLARLSAREVDEWLALSPPAGLRAEDVHRLTEGNPLFVQEALRLASSGHRLQPSDGMQALLDEHLSRLSPEAVALLESGSIFGREITPALLAALEGQTADDVSSRLGEAQHAGVLTAADGKFAFSHMLLRDRLYERLQPSRRASLHWKAGELLAQTELDLSVACHHLMEGQAAGNIDRLLEVARDAASVARRRVAFEDAVRLGQRALGFAAAHPPRFVGCELAIIVAEAELRAGHVEQGRKLAVAAADMARTIGADELLARAALAYSAEPITGAVDQLMVDLLREALSRLEEGDRPLRALVMTRLAAAMVPPAEEQIPEIFRLAREGVAMAERIGDPQTLLHSLHYAGAAIGYMISVEERLKLIQPFIALALSLNEKLLLVNAMGWHIGHLLETGQRQSALESLRAYSALFDDLPQGRYRWRLLATQAGLATFDGELDHADALSDEWLALAENERAARLAWCFQRISTACLRGRPESIAPVAGRILSQLEPMPNMAPYTAWVYAALGQRDKATALVGSVCDKLHHFPWLIGAAAATVLLEDAELARVLYGALLGKKELNRIFWGPSGIFVFGPTVRMLGDLALVMGRPQAALEHYDDALAVCTSTQAKAPLALAEQSREKLFARHPELRPSGSKAQPAQPAASTRVENAPRLTRDGELWCLTTGAGSFRLKESKGLGYLDYLLRNPGREVHVLELVGSDELAGDAGPLLDARAKEQYRARLADLRDELEEATRFADPARARRAEQEIEALAQQLAQAVGLGGRDRRAASTAERARVNVQRRLKDVFERVGEVDPTAGRYLIACVKTGTYCSFTPL